MISVDLDKIVTAKGLQEHLAGILYDVEEDEKTYIITKGGKPRAALINVDYLTELTGKKVESAEEYTKYDAELRPEMELPPVPSTPAAPAETDTVPAAQLDKVNITDSIATGPALPPSTPIKPVAPVAAPVEPPIPVNPELTAELDSLTQAPITTDDADPYAVTDENTDAPQTPPTTPAPAAQNG